MLRALDVSDNQLKYLPDLKNHKFLYYSVSKTSNTDFRGNFLTEEILKESLPDRFFLNYSWIEEQIAEQKKDTVKNQ